MPTAKNKKKAIPPKRPAKERSLTEKQKKFADLYIETGVATQSYTAAGYKASSRFVAEANARKLLADPRIKSFIEARIAAKDEARIAKQDEVLQFLTSVMRGEVVEQFPIGLGMGEQQLVKKELDGAARIKAAELLGKRYGVWSSAEELRLRLEKMRAEVAALKGNGDDETEDDGFLEALQGKASEVWSNDGGDDDGETEA